MSFFRGFTVIGIVLVLFILLVIILVPTGII